MAAFADSSSPTRPSQDFSVSERPGLKSTPMGSAVSNATDRYSLPEPALAVRNLVRPRPAVRCRLDASPRPRPQTTTPCSGALLIQQCQHTFPVNSKSRSATDSTC